MTADVVGPGGQIDVTDRPLRELGRVSLLDLASLARQDTLAAILTQLDDATADTMLSVLKQVAGKDFATQATLQALLTAFNAEDFASQATLEALRAAFVAEDFATQATLEALRAAFVAEDFASQTTLEALRAAFIAEDFATETTLATRATEITLASVLAELQKRPVYKSATALTSIAAGAAYITCVEFAPAVDVVIEGFNADFSTIVDATYRMRLITGTDAAPVVHVGEEVAAQQNSWIPFRLDLAATTRVAVQVVHNQLTAQEFRGTINYREGP